MRKLTFLLYILGAIYKSSYMLQTKDAKDRVGVQILLIKHFTYSDQQHKV